METKFYLLLSFLNDLLQINQKLITQILHKEWGKKEEPCEVCSTQSQVLANSVMRAKHFLVFVA
jgi:hypothetical protein